MQYFFFLPLLRSNTFPSSTRFLIFHIPWILAKVTSFFLKDPHLPPICQTIVTLLKPCFLLIFSDWSEQGPPSLTWYYLSFRVICTWLIWLCSYVGNSSHYHFLYFRLYKPCRLLHFANTKDLLSFCSLIIVLLCTTSLSRYWNSGKHPT